MDTSPKLEVFSDLFDGSLAELGNVIAFTGGYFDESLWQTPSWYFGYQFAKLYLEEASDRLLVKRGSSLEEALLRWKTEYPNGSDTFVSQTYADWEEAQALLDYGKPFENGAFQSESNGEYGTTLRRYINVCPTNEEYIIQADTRQIRYAQWKFEKADFENLPDVAAYLGRLDLSAINVPAAEPGTLAREVIFCWASGMYVKTDTGVLALIQITWLFTQEGSFDYYPQESMCWKLTADGAEAMTEEELERLNLYL